MQVDHFKYLGSILTPSVTIDKSIRNRNNTVRLKWAKAIFSRSLCDAKMPIEIKENVSKQAIGPALIQGSECWAMQKSDEQLLQRSCDELEE